MKKALKDCTKKLNIAHGKYVDVIGSVEALLAEYTDFDFGILYQSGDGFIVCDEFGNNAPVRHCIDKIIETGSLPHAEYRKLTI